MENSRKSQHREFVQQTIIRMNTNSFQTKGMMITIVAAFLGIYASNLKVLFLIIPIPIILLFWFLDAYYLQLERKFRGIYNDICDVTEIDEKITTKVFLMNPKLYKGQKYKYINNFFSKSITPLYSIIILGLTLVYYYITCSCNN